jgi:hypothetical protein
MAAQERILSFLNSCSGRREPFYQSDANDIERNVNQQATE